VSAAWALLRRDLVLAWREGGTIGTALGFYLVVVVVTPLGLGPDLNLLSRIAPGILWVALLLASLLSADRIFHNDYEDGALDVLATGPLPLEVVAAAKSLAHSLTTGIPLALLAPMLGLLLNLPIDAYPPLVLAMLDLRRVDGLSRVRRPRLALATVPHPLRTISRQHRPRANRFGGRLTRSVALGYESPLSNLVITCPRRFALQHSREIENTRPKAELDA